METTQIKLPARLVRRTLKAFYLDYTKKRNGNDTGQRIDITSPGFDTIVITAYDNGTVNIQGGKGEQAALVDQLKTVMRFHMIRLECLEK